MMTATMLGRGLPHRALTGLLAALSLTAGLLIVNTAPATAADLPYGPYTCKQGYVWREAVPGDLVCVTPAQRTQTANENALGPSRVEPAGGAYGPDTCKSSYVWRETRPSDHVCVPPASRDRATVDNRIAPFTLEAPNATPANGVYVNEVRLSSPYRVQLYAQATFTPNKRVQFYSYDPYLQHGDRGLTLLADITTDWTGTLTSPSNHAGGKNIYFTYCTWVQSNGWLTAPVVIVDQGTGVVSSTGWNLTAPWC